MTQYIIARSKWGAASARGTKSHTPRRVVIHHTAGRAAWGYESAAREMRAMQSFHQRGRGWSDIGYHIVVDRAGRLWEGRPMNVVGAHTAGHNTGSIGISVMGNYENQRLTWRQKRALKAAARIIKSRYRIDRVTYHRQLTGDTACPGRHIISQMNRIKGYFA